jgi:aspartyl-tRNA(Asn)/glutamyl-tRNA(Gln) amidotransferase subunit A
MPTLVPQPDDTLAGIARAIRDGQRTCREVVEACLARIERDEPRVRAWVKVDHAGAMVAARRLDDQIAAGSAAGALHGVPVGIKDIVDVAGLPTAAGFRPWSDRIAASDAPLVTRLRAAGAVIVGKTVTTCFASFDPPRTRNPWNIERTPGGSSSGSAAAVACGMVSGAVGSQTGGSITRPAAFCGVAGIKPTYGRLDATGFVPLAPSMDHPGFLASTLDDLEILWRAVTGADAMDTARPPSGSMRIGRLRGLFDERAEPAMRAAMDRALDAVGKTGIEIVDVSLPNDFDTVIHHHEVIMAAEAAAWHQRLYDSHRADYPPRIRGLVEEGLAAPATAYISARQYQDRLRQEIAGLLGHFDALATPAAVGPAPDVSTTGNPIFNSPWSFTGLPTVNFPIGLSPDGLPLGMQLVGKALGETALLEVARRCAREVAALLASPG